MTAQDEVKAELIRYYPLANNNRVVIWNLWHFHSKGPFSSLPDAVLSDIPDSVRPEIDRDTAAVIGNTWGAEHGALAAETQLWGWGADVDAPTRGWPQPFSIYPFRTIQTARLFTKHYGIGAIGAIAAATVESGPLLVEDGNSFRRVMHETTLPRILYTRKGEYVDDFTGGPHPDDTPENSGGYGLSDPKYTDAALITHLFAAPIGLDGPAAILKLWDDAATLYRYGLTRPNDLGAESGHLRAVFEHYLVNADEKMLRLFTFGPQRIPLGQTALLARPGEAVRLPLIRTWTDLVHAYFPRHHKDIWSMMATVPLPQDKVTDLGLKAAAESWCAQSTRPCDWANKTGSTTQLLWWLRALANGHSSSYGDSITDGIPEGWRVDLSQVLLPDRKVEGRDSASKTLRDVARVVAVVSTIVASAAGLLFTGGNAAILVAGMSILAMISKLAISPEGAMGETLLWVSRLKMPLDQISLADQVVMQDLATKIAATKTSIDTITGAIK